MGFTIRKSLILVVMFVMTGLGGNVFAQNVTVSPSTGKLIGRKRMTEKLVLSTDGAPCGIIINFH
jgi:hypothetical protein